MPRCESAPPDNNSTIGNQSGGGKNTKRPSQPNEPQPQKEPKRTPPMNFAPGKPLQNIQSQSDFGTQSTSKATSSLNLFDGVGNIFNSCYEVLTTVPNILFRTFSGQ